MVWVTQGVSSWNLGQSQMNHRAGRFGVQTGEENDGSFPKSWPSGASLLPHALRQFRLGPVLWSLRSGWGTQAGLFLSRNTLRSRKVVSLPRDGKNVEEVQEPQISPTFTPHPGPSPPRVPLSGEDQHSKHNLCPTLRMEFLSAPKPKQLPLRSLLCHC